MFSFPASAQSGTISDINSSSLYARQSILRLHKLGILSGDNNGNFSPARPIKRAEMVKMLVLSLNINYNSTTNTKPTFRDVPSHHWAYPYIEAAHREGIVNGTSPGIFQPEKYCTREEMTTMLVRSFGLTNKQIGENFNLNFVNNFNDSYQISEWAKASIEFALRTDLVNGTSTNSFSPKMSAKREQAAVIIDRLIINKNFITQTVNTISQKGKFPQLYLALMENFLHYRGRMSSIHNLNIEDLNNKTSENIIIRIDGINNMENYHLNVKITSETKNRTSVIAYETIKYGQMYYIKYSGDDTWRVEKLQGSQTDLSENIELQKTFLGEFKNFNIENKGLVYLNRQPAYRYSLGVNKEALSAILPNLLMDYNKDLGSLSDIDTVFNDGYNINTDVYINENSKLLREVHRFTGSIKKVLPERLDITIQSTLDSSYTDIGRNFNIKPPEIN